MPPHNNLVLRRNFWVGCGYTQIIQGFNKAARVLFLV